MKILSYGGGIQTTALAVLVAEGQVETDHIVFADPGSEDPRTYVHIKGMQQWLGERGLEITTVRAPVQPLYEYVWDRSAVIPVRIGHNEGLGHRQCTRQWKITPVLSHARSLTDERPIIMQLGISIDEAHRMKDSPDKDVIREWPLIDLGLRREDCRTIIREAGLPEPPKSACYFCPLRQSAYFKGLASTNPVLFEKAAALEDRINERRQEQGKEKGAYLTPSGIPLRLLATGQSSFLDQVDNEAEECEGVCFV